MRSLPFIKARGSIQSPAFFFLTSEGGSRAEESVSRIYFSVVEMNVPVHSAVREGKKMALDIQDAPLRVNSGNKAANKTSPKLKRRS